MLLLLGNLTANVSCNCDQHTCFPINRWEQSPTDIWHRGSSPWHNQPFKIFGNCL